MMVASVAMIQLWGLYFQFISLEIQTFGFGLEAEAESRSWT